MGWYRLKIVGMKNSKIRKAMNLLDTYESLLKLEKDILIKELNYDSNDIELIRKSSEIKEYKKDLELRNIEVINLNDKEYPEELKNISLPPLFLYYMGNISLLKEKKIAVVGSRRGTKYGKNFIENLAKTFSENNIVTISGFAQGIDISIHREMLRNNGKTIAIMPCGLDRIYPTEHLKEWKEIIKKGLIISEYSIGIPPYPGNFPLRNRLIGGLGKGVVIVESGERGGSLITAELALEEGRDVYALPGDITSPFSIGCNNLIKNNRAKLITCGIDILEEYQWNIKEKEETFSIINNEENMVYQQLTTGMTIDELILCTNFDGKKLIGILSELELKNMVIALSGGRYKRKV